MEIEVMMPSPPLSGCNTPYMSAPSSPPRPATLFYSAPASPTRISPLYDDFNWEEKDINTNPHEDNDFAFDFSGQLERISFSAADELFDGGKIKPLKPPSPPPPPRYMDSPKKLGSKNSHSSSEGQNCNLSLFKVSDLLFDQESNQETPKKSASVSSSSSSSSSSSVSSMISNWSKKWKLKDLLLFRSSSEGRPSSTEQLNKYELLKNSHGEDVKNSSFRSTDSVRSKRKGHVSAHELHYTMNRAVSEEMKKKTFLPYKQGLLGCLGFNAALQDSVSKSVANSMSMSHR
ncbi:hypothetical protein K7X08_036934 [Anisodus acutangulus]|uniref:Uncharacterized protein n=1 Tax=Anisodus acutangulus TaxID=402998 RepID=A0A9Q1LAL5_9SOLA|nr:hypothetical protein K7X08_036934 [Anisodus acutangulus]